MPELPEAVVMARQMDEIIHGKTIASVEVLQPKILNKPEKTVKQILAGLSIKKVYPFGKWVGIQLSDRIRLMISLGMGGEIIYFRKGERPSKKSRFVLHFTDQSGFYITLWWFGYVHLILHGEKHDMTDSLGPDPLEMEQETFHQLLSGRKGSVKSFLLNQKRIRGIGNFYIQEILFQAKLHPFRTIPSLSRNEIDILLNAIQSVFHESIRLDSSWYEQDFFGKKGRYTLENMSFTFQENDRCPACRHPIEKIKTGSTSQLICARCQKI